MGSTSFLTWDTARAAGFVAYLLVAASVAIGLVLSLRWRGRLWTRFVTTELHRFVTLLSLVFIAVHGVSVLIDPFIKFTPAEVLVPLVSHYRPVWMAFGIVAGYLTAAIWLSERIQRRIGYAWWRRLHYLTFVVYGLATVHGLATGSDTKTTWGLVVYGGSFAVVAGLLCFRLLDSGPHEVVRQTVAALGVALVAGVALWTWSGPLQPGWSAAAGGASQPGATAAPAQGSTTVAGAQATPAPSGQGSASAPALSPIQSRFSGAFDPQSATVSAQLTDGTLLSLQLAGQDDGAGRLLVTSAQASLREPGAPACQGTLQATGAEGLSGSCTTPDGRSLTLRVALRGDEAGRVRGTVVASNP